MFDVIIKRAIEEYVSNIKVMLSFGSLLLFLPLFVLFQQFFLGSGTIFLSLNTGFLAIIGLIIVLVFLYIVSFFVSLTVYAVHRDIQSISLDDYWNTLFKDAALKIFFLYLSLSVLLYLISYVGFITGSVGWALLLNLLISLAMMFAPQSIVLNESSIFGGVRRSIEFWAENPAVSSLIFLIATILLAIVLGIELLLDSLGLPGILVSFFLVLVFVVPFIEQMKSYAYLLRVDLLRSNEVVHSRAPRVDRPKPLYGVRLRERPRHGSKL